jgi:hypothetical protein
MHVVSLVSPVFGLAEHTIDFITVPFGLDVLRWVDSKSMRDMIDRHERLFRVRVALEKGEGCGLMPYPEWRIEHALYNTTLKSGKARSSVELTPLGFEIDASCTKQLHLSFTSRGLKDVRAWLQA